MKKVLAIILALTLVVLCFAGCEKKTSSNDEIPTLKWYCPGDTFPGTAEVLEKANEISVKEIGAKLDIQFIDTGAFNERIRMIMASGEKFDLVFTGYLNVYSQAAQMGGLAPLDELLETTPALVESIDDFFWDAATVDGQIYGVPNMQIVSGPTTPFVRMDLAEKYGLDVESISDHRQLEPWFEAIMKGEKGSVYPFKIGSGFFSIEDEETLGDEFVIGVKYQRGTDKPKVFFHDRSESWIKGIKVRNEWYKKGYIRPDVTSVTDDGMDYRAGKYAVSNGTYKPGAEIGAKNQTGHDWKALPQFIKPFVQYDNATATLIGINPNSQHKEKAIKLIELLNTNIEYYNLICYGIEGKHYEKLENGTVRYIEGANYKPAGDWKFGNQFNAYVVEGNDPDVWEKTKKMNDEAEKSVLLGFVLNKDNVQAELASCETVRKQYGTAYFQGAMPYEKGYEEYLKRMETAGIDVVIKDFQKQVDEFLAKKNKKK